MFKVKAVYQYEKSHEDDLAIDEGAIISVSEVLGFVLLLGLYSSSLSFGFVLSLGHSSMSLNFGFVLLLVHSFSSRGFGV